MGLERRRQMIEPGHPQLSILRQGALISISQSGLYRQPGGGSRHASNPLRLERMRRVRRSSWRFRETPWCGSRRMVKMSLAPIYPRPRTSTPHHKHRIFP
jgi:putative transposase